MGQTALTSITIPEGIKSIATDAFSGCTGLTSVTINSLDIIEEERKPTTSFKAVFGDNVTSYVISDRATSIGNYAFYGCSKMTSFNIPTGVSNIGSSAFSMCKGLTSITIPDAVSVINHHLFYGCSNLSSVSMSEDVTRIENDAFSLCRSLTSFAIPGMTTFIGNAAFYGCSELREIGFPEGVDSIGREAFAYCLKLTSAILPPSLAKVSNYVFYSCQSLNDVYIGYNVKYIGSNAFSRCTALTSIICDADVVPETEIDAFDYLNPDEITVTVPSELQEEYKANDVWSVFFEENDGFVSVPDDDPDGICSAPAAAQAAQEVYGINGVKQNALRRGLNIVRMTDGTTKKIVVK